jgi:hypothetical protein
VSRFLLLVGMLLAMAAPAAARPASDAEIAALEQRIASFDAAMRDGDYAAIVTVIPPPVLQRIADDAKVPVDQLEAALAGQMEEILKTVTLVSFGMELEAAEHRELADGTPYLLIPTETVMEAEGMGRMKVESFTLAMLDGGNWYLVRTGDAAMVGILRQVYPQFTGVAFPADSTTPLGE